MDIETAEYARRAWDFPGLRILVRADGEVRHANGDVLSETRYFAPSLDPGTVSARQLLALVRGHRGVENSPHHIKDRLWDVDRHRLTRPGLAERFTAMVNAALGLLRMAPGFDPDEPIKARADELNWDIGRVIDLFTRPIQ